MRAKNARFWTFENDGYIKITLRPGQSLTWGWSARHEEGWSSEVLTWTHTGTAVELEVCTDGRDCDGRSSDDRVLTCPLDLLHDFVPMLDALAMPDWQPVSRRQRDEFAEAANY